MTDYFDYSGSWKASGLYSYVLQPQCLRVYKQPTQPTTV